MIDINYIFKLWIEPELTFRRNQGSIDNNFKVQRCLIKFPPDSKCIIEFNNEIHWNARVEHAFETSKSKGTPVFQHEIKKIIDIDPPEYEGEKVAFVYIQFIGHDATRSYYTMVFDFFPNAKRQGLPADESRINLALTDCLNKLLQDRVLISCTQYEQILRQIGLWTAPALLPYPLSKIIVKLNENKKDEAIGLLVSCGTPEFIEQLVQKWWSCEPFLKRKKLIEDSLEAHRSQKYTLSIHALIPAIEGIITEFILLNLPEDE